MLLWVLFLFWMIEAEWTAATEVLTLPTDYDAILGVFD